MFRNKKKSVLSVIILVLRRVVFGARILKPRAAKRAEIPTMSTQQIPAATTAKHSPVQVVRFTLYDVGIYPRQARVNKGLVAITIEDLSGGTSGLVVQRVNGNARQSVGTVHRIQNHSRGQEEIQLEPGNYEVFMANRPNNVAQLVVEP